jgi:hypothetical protein
MADPRAFTGFQGIGAEILTFYADDFGTGTATIVYDAKQNAGSAQVGRAVTVVSVSGGKAEIDLADDGQLVLGKLVRVEADGACSVQVAGGMTLPGGNGATLTLGSRIVGAQGPSNALGYIRSVAAAGGTYAQAASTDTQRGRGMILDASTPAKTQVWL